MDREDCPLRKARKLAKLTQLEASKRLCVTTRTYQEYEYGKVPIPVSLSLLVLKGIFTMSNKQFNELLNSKYVLDTKQYYKESSL